MEAAGLPAHTLAQIEPLLVMLGVLNEQIKSADKRLEEIVKADEVVKRLCSVPGVGPVVDTTFASTLDDASRFLGARHVRSYLGLVEAAWSLLRWKTERTRALHGWWARVAQRRVRENVRAVAARLAEHNRLEEGRSTSGSRRCRMKTPATSSA